jgi:hypothetical protein
MGKLRVGQVEADLNPVKPKLCARLNALEPQKVACGVAWPSHRQGRFSSAPSLPEFGEGSHASHRGLLYRSCPSRIGQFEAAFETVEPFVNAQDVALKGVDLGLKAKVHVVDLLTKRNELLTMVLADVRDIGLNLLQDLVDELVCDDRCHRQTLHE